VLQVIVVPIAKRLGTDNFSAIIFTGNKEATVNTRICSTCKIEKSLYEFHKSKRHSEGRKKECADCTNLYLRNHYNFKTKLKKDFKLKRIKSYYKRQYNIEYEDYLSLCKDNDYKCSICSKIKPVSGSQEGIKDVLVLDHCHSSGKIRGVLCQECNQGLGLFRDNINNLVMAHLYLLQTESDKSEDAMEGV
jgi:hypothetical protein